MDFGAIKRIEMEGVQPIKDKHGFMTNGGNVDRAKPQKEHKKGHRQSSTGNGAQQDNENTDSEHVLDAKVTGLSGEEHILDFKA